MNAIKQLFLVKSRECVPAWVLVLLLTPLLYFLYLVAQQPLSATFSGQLPWHVLSGKLFTSRFDIIHAGASLDQPTIGKWLFWFGIGAIIYLPQLALVRWMGTRKTRLSNTFAWFYTLAIIVPLLCILALPAAMLTQYVVWMGLTLVRVAGLIFIPCAAWGMVLMLRWALRREQSAFCKNDTARAFLLAGISFLPTLFFLTDWYRHSWNLLFQTAALTVCAAGWFIVLLSLKHRFLKTSGHHTHGQPPATPA